jgi:hypothetical protein
MPISDDLWNCDISGEIRIKGQAPCDATDALLLQRKRNAFPAALGRSVSGPVWFWPKSVDMQFSLCVVWEMLMRVVRMEFRIQLNLLMRSWGRTARLVSVLVMGAAGVFGQDGSAVTVRPGASGEGSGDTRLDLKERVTENLRWAIDLSVRGGYSTLSDAFESEQNLGLDLHKVFSGATRDWATVVFQPYLVRIDNAERFPAFFEGPNDWEFTLRNAYVEFKLMPSSQLNFRVGHVEVPFGLETAIDTHGTLRQLITGQNLGVKPDWGAGLNGSFETFRYDVFLSRGSGMEYLGSGDPFALTARVSTSRDSESILGAPGYGVSLFYGEVLGRSGVTERSRVAADALWQFGPFGALFELSTGRDESVDVVNGLAELNWQSPGEVFMVYAQSKNLNRQMPSGWDDAWVVASGLRFAPDAHWALSAQFERDVRQFGVGKRRGFFTLQARYRF